MIVGRFQLPWAVGLSFSLADGVRGPSAPCHVGLSNMAAYFISVYTWYVSKIEATVFYHLIVEVISQNFRCTLFFRSKSLRPAHTQGEEITQGCEYQEAGIPRSHVRRMEMVLIITIIGW